MDRPGQSHGRHPSRLSAAAEGASNIAYCQFSFPSLAAYEQYRKDSESDPECQAAFALATEQRFILSYERSFMRPVFG